MNNEDFLIELREKNIERIDFLNKKILKMEFNSLEKKYVSITRNVLVLNKQLLELSDFHNAKRGVKTCH